MKKNTLSLDTILKDSLWVAKMQGWRKIGTYEEIGDLSKNEECRDFDLSAEQPDHLKDFYEQYWEYDRKNGFITVQDFYNDHFKEKSNMKLYDLWQVAPQSAIFIRRDHGTEEYTGWPEEADRIVKSIRATSYEMYKSVIEVELEA